MIKQYLAIKANYKDAILFYRIGDFYEMFFEDANIASRILDIALTSRNKKEEIPIQMCGIPYRSAKNYIPKLINKGYKVAICDQLEDASLFKGIIKRDVVKVITPGMIVDTELLDSKLNNYILAVNIIDNKTIGISYLDISTGVFRVTEDNEINKIIEECLRIDSSEILMPEKFKNASQYLVDSIIKAFDIKLINFLEDRFFDFRESKKNLIEQFGTISLDGFGCENLKSGVGAAGALISYVKETQKQRLIHISKIETYSLNNYLLIDDISFRNLEIIKSLKTGSTKGTLLEAIDRTVTSMGARLFSNWIRYPLLDIEKIKDRLDSVDEALKENIIRKALRESLKKVSDLERIVTKIVMGHANARDLLALKQSLNMLSEIIDVILPLKSKFFKWDFNIKSLNNLYKLIDMSICDDAPIALNEGNIIKEGYDKELDELILISRDSKSYIAKLEAKEKEKTNISSLKIRYNKIFGYYIEITKSRLDAIPPHYIRKQTMTNAERFITEELKDFETKILEAEDRRTSLELEIYNKIREEIIADNLEILNLAKFLAQLDVMFALAEIAEHQHFCKPEITSGGEIIIEDGRHPVIEQMLLSETFIPNSLQLDDFSNQILIITGPNMAGKSTILRQVALIVLMAQIGSFVPAKKACIGIIDRIFTRVGALDNLSQGQSTFMVEMQETANILNNATNKSLIIMDEIGRGTSTFDGLSIAWSVAEYLHDLNNKGVKTLFATHYHEITELAKIKPRVKNFNIAVKESKDKIIFLRKIVEGSTNKSYGIQVASLAGIPVKVVERAKEVLYRIEKTSELSICETYASDNKKKETKKGHMQLCFTF